MEFNDPIYIAGHAGLIGSAIERRLQEDGYLNLLTSKHSELELTNGLLVQEFFSRNKPKYVFLAAGKVGGIRENNKYPADFLTVNLAIQLNILKAAADSGVERLVLYGSSCMYPRETDQPMTEDVLLEGKPEPTSIAYAIAKLAGVHMCLAYNKQFGSKRFLPVIPNSTYGPNDNFSEDSGHVLSSLVARFHNAMISGADVVTVWGTGKPRREFIHADDVARASIMLMSRDLSDINFPLNIGVGEDYSILELAQSIASVVGYNGEIQFDLSKPDGAARKILDSKRLMAMGWKPEIEFIDGLKKTYEWYLTCGE